MLPHFSAVASILASVSVFQASPTRHQSDNGFCSQLIATCAVSPNALTDPWSTEACIFGATCFGGPRPVDGFLAEVVFELGQPAPTSSNVPCVSTAIFDNISTDGRVITQQNFIDGVFGTLDETNGPFPDSSFVVSDYQRVASWTEFCNGQGVPYMNFADYYQFSATTSSSGCSTTISISSSTIPITSAMPTPTTVTVIITPTFIPNISTSINEPSFLKQFTLCLGQVNSAVTDAWSHPPCLFAATCIDVQNPIDALLAALCENLISNGPTSFQEARLSNETMRAISTDGTTITQQNWIDAYYRELTTVSGPFPINSSIVINEFSRIVAWTGFCTGVIPFMNVADYFQYSSSISSILC